MRSAKVELTDEWGTLHSAVHAAGGMGFLSDLFWQRLGRGLRKLRHHSPWEDFAGANWDERCLAVGSDHPLYAKQGRTITPWELKQNGQTLAVFLKCHYR